MKRLSIFFAALMACTLSFAATFVKTDLTNIKSTDVVIITATKADGSVFAMSNDNGTKAPSAVAVTVESFKIETEATNILWNINYNATAATFTILPAGTTNHLYCTDANNGVKVGTNKDSIFSIKDDYIYHAVTKRYLGVYNAQDWRCYTNATGNTANQTFAFYVQGEGKDIPATAIALDQTTLELEQYKSAKLVATLTPADATTPVAWTSSTPEVATINANGVISTLTIGTTTITATAGELTATCNLTVKAATVLTIEEAAAKGLTATADNKAIDGGKYVARGFVSKIGSAYSTTYKNLSVYLSDTKDNSEAFQAYRAVPATTAEQSLKVGDYVEVVGELGQFKGAPQFLAGAVITRLADKYVVAATANDDAMGTVTGAGIYDENAEVTVTATAKKGYRFMGWSNGETNATLTFTAADVTLVANFQSVANTFAYGLESELSTDGTELNVIYELNNNAKAVQIIIMNGEDVVNTVDCQGITKGMHMETINTSTLPKNVKLTWKVEITDIANEAVAEIGTTYSFYHPSAVDIDLNPENETFGLILCNEAMHVAKGKKGYQSSNFGAGIFAFTPDFKPIANGEKPGFNGGNEFVEKDATGTSYVPRRIRISKDGRIFVTSLGANGTYLWEVNPKNMDEWTPVMTGTADEQYELVDAEGNFIAGPNAGFDVRGEGENLQLLMLSANKSGFAYAPAGYKCSEYNLGTATTWNQTRTRTIFDGIYGINPAGVQVQYDAEGGVWFASNRAATKDNEPGLVHFNAAGVEDYKELRNNTKNAGFRFNHDFTKVVIGTNGKIGTIYAVSKDAEGKPVLTEEMQISMTTAGANLNDFAWDYANNLYVVSNSGEKIVAYALPHTADTKVATPAASKYAFAIGGTGTYVDNTEANTTVTEKVVRNGQVLIIRDGKTYNMMGQVVE